MTYTISFDGFSVYRSDGACIPTDLDNTDYHGYLDWVAQGNTAEVLPETHPTPAESSVMGVNTISRRTKIAGAKVRARQIVTLAQTPGARTSTAWTQAQRIAILDAVGDLALMLSWLADDILFDPEPPD